MASGKVTFKVVYDAKRNETQWNLWQKAGNDWLELADYDPPPRTTKAITVTREFADGYYSFRIHDSGGNGLVKRGSFRITEVDTKKVLFKGRAFRSSFGVEFEVVSGVVTKTWSGELHDEAE
jgi:hypothetical protein